MEEKKDNINVKALAIKRWKRLSPFYLTVVILLTIYYWVLNQNVPGDFWSYFVYAQNFYWAIKGDVGTRVPASYHFGYLILDFYLFIVWTRVIEYTKNDRLLRIFWCMLVFSIVYRCVIPQITGNAILAYTMPWGMFDAFSVGGILAIRTKEKKPLLKTGHISAIVAVLLFIICVVSMMRANNVGGGRAITMFSTSNNYGESPITMQIFTVMTLLSCSLIRYCLSIKKNCIFTNNKIANLGGLSYELHVLHFPILFFVAQVVENKWIVGIAAFLITIGLSKLWKLIYK
ncbi:acyltransferase family protein [Bacteroides uniformis]